MSKAISYFANGLGNYVMLMPALAAVASMTDSKTIDVCLSGNWNDYRKPSVEMICKAWGVVGRVIHYPGDWLDPARYDLWFHSPHGDNGCDIVYYFKEQLKWPEQKFSWRSTRKHETDHYMEIAKFMGYKGDIPKVEFPLASKPVLNLSRPIIGLCNGYFRTSNRYWTKKEWPHFVRLSHLLRDYFGASIVGVGLKNELPPDVTLTVDYMGKLTILETAKVISQLDLLVTTDTGLMHIADMIGISMIALFGPTLISKNSPRGNRSHVLQAGIECAPCQDTGRFHSCQYFACMKDITVGDVMAKANEILINFRR